jgi:hypothetical protein
VEGILPMSMPITVMSDDALQVMDALLKKHPSSIVPRWRAGTRPDYPMS